MYYIMHPSYRGELQKYLILNTTNFYPSLPGEKSGFVRVGIRVRVIDVNIKNQSSVIWQKNELRNIICQV